MKRRRELEVFTLSFLDIISCGFGAVVLLVLISPFSVSDTEGDGAGVVASLLERVLDVEARVSDLEAILASEAGRLAEARAARDAQREAAAGAERETAEAAAESLELERSEATLEAVKQSQRSRERARVSAPSAPVRDDEVGGIPVDSDYVVFIVDTSGSMQLIWERVVREVENVIRIHPRIKGFQVLNDNGQHLIGGYAGRWIPDTVGSRDRAIRLFRTWQSASNSSPVEGLEVALRRYVGSGRQSVSIYIFGDDYSGGSYDPVISSLRKLNVDRGTGAPRARVHAVGFLTPYSEGRFEVLMREVTRQHNGTFMALPP